MIGEIMVDRSNNTENNATYVKIQMIRGATAFIKDGIEWNSIFNILLHKKNLEKEKIDDSKLIHIASLSLETILKGIYILRHPNVGYDKKIQKIFKDDFNHNIGKLYHDLGIDFLEKDEKDLIERRHKYGIGIRYKIEALMAGLEVEGLESNRPVEEQNKIKKNIKKDYEIYGILFKKFVGICKELCNFYKIPFESLISYGLGVADIHHVEFKKRYK